MLSAAAAELTRGHRTRVATAADLTVNDSERLLRSFDPVDIDAWWQRMAGRFLTLIGAGYDVTAALAGSYLAEHAGMEGVDLDPVIADFDPEQVVAAMQIQTVARAKRQIGEGLDPDVVKRLVVKRGRGTARRLTLAGSRDTIIDTFDFRPVIVGYRRVTSAGACSFCQMLAGRGAVYRSEQSASTVGARDRGRPRRTQPGRRPRRRSTPRPRGNRRIGQSFHDNCRCTVEPLYDFDL